MAKKKIGAIVREGKCRRCGMWLGLKTINKGARGEVELVSDHGGLNIFGRGPLNYIPCRGGETKPKEIRTVRKKW